MEKRRHDLGRKFGDDLFTQADIYWHKFGTKRSVMRDLSRAVYITQYEKNETPIVSIFMMTMIIGLLLSNARFASLREKKYLGASVLV